MKNFINNSCDGTETFWIVIWENIYIYIILKNILASENIKSLYHLHVCKNSVFGIDAQRH